MTFSAVTCLTYTGSTPLGGFINIYSDSDGYTTPFQTNIPLSNFIAPNCPYYINNIPSGSTTIRLQDIPTNCSVEFDLQSNNLCQTCDLNFDVFSSETVSRIVAGNLTGSCADPITDYLIHWYETGDTINPAYISGFGSEFTPYSFTHPLTTTSAIIAQEGTYEAIIQKVKVDDLIFSLTGGSGTIPAEIEDCFDATKITVNPLTCDNGDVANEPYFHRFEFKGNTTGEDAPPLEATFNISASTNYIPFKFKGESVPDRLTIFYNGDEYGEPIVLEDIVVGSGIPGSAGNLNNYVLPKSADTSGFMVKILTLTGLTRSPNDSLTIKVTPSAGNPQTNWDFSCACLDSIDQTSCAFNEDPKKIVFSSITSTTGACTTNAVNFKVRICQYDVDTFTTYMSRGGTINGYTGYYNSRYFISSDPPDSFSSNSLVLSKEQMNIQENRFYLQGDYTPSCSAPNTNTITYKKYINGMGIGEINIESDSIDDINHYYSKFNLIQNGIFPSSKSGCYSAGEPYSGTPFDSSNQDYYRWYELWVPKATGVCLCGSDTCPGVKEWKIHPSTVVTTGTTMGGGYYMNMTMPTVVNNYPNESLTCPGYYTFIGQQLISPLNNSSTGTASNYTGTTNTGSKFIEPFRAINYCSGSTSTLSLDKSGEFRIGAYFNETIPFSGGVIQPTLSAQTFTAFNDTNIWSPPLTSGYGWDYYKKYNFYYRTSLNNPVDYRDFEIGAIEYTGNTLGSYVLIYGYTGATGIGTVYDPSYFIM